MIQNYKYRLLTKKKDYQRLDELVEEQRVLYNSALQERIEAYKKTHTSLSYYDQCRSLVECRKIFPDMKAVPDRLQRGTLHRLDRAFQFFFRRVQKGKKPGFPRFKGKNRYSTLEWREFVGIRLKDGKLKSKAFGSIAVHFHRPLPDAPIKGCLIGRDVKGWFVCFYVELPIPDKGEVRSLVGVDMGLNDFVTLSNGEKIPSLRVARKAARKLRVKNRALVRCQRRSNRRQKVKKDLSRCYMKITNIRRDFQHQISKMLIDNYDLIALEKLNVQGMAKNKHISRSMYDASWSSFIEMLEYKAEKAGKRVVKVDAKYTSQECSRCKTRQKLTLKQRQYNCQNCGVSLDRDHNAALNILSRAAYSPGEPKVIKNYMLALGNSNFSESLY